jgi:hypothetical protein
VVEAVSFRTITYWIQLSIVAIFRNWLRAIPSSMWRAITSGGCVWLNVDSDSTT